MQSSSKPDQPLTDEERRAAIRRTQMDWLDTLPPALRAVANGLPRLEYLPHAIEAGCTTQEEAEEWMRFIFGRSCEG